MPTYVYKCAACGHTAERTHSATVTEHMWVYCRECQVKLGESILMVKVPAAFNFNFKGGKPT
jgi:predicted nucleic acid-binding Zn ribbon protein